ncbi:MULTISPECIES: DNA-processing protein DprA [unclassified Brevibacterium]|uniref:DNA-processing protein DprA n=1 Tax=unclassified Brevibacterium TaxID=2614124 RepID=UPI00108136E4|nr:DNA-processing protein DprA [Brevibacterium sp. S111]TGD11322.1 DNA-protecting protein DprA [Brevibacterium sp. S111]
MTVNTNEEVRAAIASLLRIGEPGDGLLKRLVDDIGPVAAHTIVTVVGRGEATADEAMAGLNSTGAEAATHGQMREAIERWAVRAGDEDVAVAGRDLDKIARLGGRLVIPGDEEWPSMLDDLGPAAPLGLWVRGTVSLTRALSRAVAVVGARAASNYGTKCASDLAWDLAAHGITVVSGGAFGIDAAAHRAAIAREAPTIAFMAGGVDRFYPAANADLFEQILATGAIVSETAPGMTPMRHRFLLRNRLIAASAQVSVIVEAGWRSGALNTARHALELSRQVAAFPGSVYSASSTGAHRLVREHEAELVTCSDDVIALMDDHAPALFDTDSGASQRPDPLEDLGEREKICLNALTVSKPLDVGTIASRAGLTITGALSSLTVLDLAGLAERRDTGWVKLRVRR